MNAPDEENREPAELLERWEKSGEGWQLLKQLLASDRYELPIGRSLLQHNPALYVPIGKQVFAERPDDISYWKILGAAQVLADVQGYHSFRQELLKRLPASDVNAMAIGFRSALLLPLDPNELPSQRVNEFHTLMQNIRQDSAEVIKDTFPWLLLTEALVSLRSGDYGQAEEYAREGIDTHIALARASHCVVLALALIHQGRHGPAQHALRLASDFLSVPPQYDEDYTIAQILKAEAEKLLAESKPLAEGR